MKLKLFVLCLTLFALYLLEGNKGLPQKQTVKLSQDTFTDALVMKTKTAFEQKKSVEAQSIKYETEYEYDSGLELGTERTVKKGKEGAKEVTYLVTFWQNEVLDKQVINTKTTPPVTEVIAKGTKVVWKEIELPGAGKIKYWNKLEVWATKYDGNCFGCRGLTFSGTPVRKGTCAVDPKVITMGSYFYVEGYGLCKAEDIGGGIKGNKIDLGYENVQNAPWRTGYTTIYLLTEPDQ